VTKATNVKTLKSFSKSKNQDLETFSCSIWYKTSLWYL